MERLSSPIPPPDLARSRSGAMSPCSTTTAPSLVQQQQNNSITIPDAPIVACSQHLLQPNGSILGAQVAEVLLPKFQSLLDAIPRSTSGTGHDSSQQEQQQQQPGQHILINGPRPALSCIDGRKSISHDDVYNFIQKVGQQLHASNIGRGHRIAVVLPNGSPTPPA